MSRLLVVEDDPGIRSALIHALSDHGHAVDDTDRHRCDLPVQWTVCDHPPPQERVHGVRERDIGTRD